MKLGKRVANYRDIEFYIKGILDDKYMYYDVPKEARSIRSNRSYNIFIYMDIFNNLR